jgi:hypothetical protein
MRAKSEERELLLLLFGSSLSIERLMPWLPLLLPLIRAPTRPHQPWRDFFQATPQAAAAPASGEERGSAVAER